jgi:DUF917 family protein
MKLNNTNVDALLRGASLLACGGGLSFREQQRLVATKAVRAALDKGVSLLPPTYLPPNAVVATVSEVGAADAPVVDKSNLPAALKLLEQKTGKKIAAIIPGEVGQEAIMIDAATILGLPIIDADFSGGRAVPRLSDSILLRNGVPFTMSPLVVLFTDGRMQFIGKQESLRKDEQLVRALVPKGQIVTIVGGMVDIQTVVRFLDQKSYSMAMNIGLRAKAHQRISDTFPSPILFGPVWATVKSVKQLSSKGFNEKHVVLGMRSGEATLTIQNEFMSCTFGERMFAFPQMIMLLNASGSRGLHSSEVIQGKRVVLMIADAFACWKGKI